MNGDRLFEAIGEIDCDLVNNADTAKKVRIKPFKIVIAVAAALVLLIGGALGVTLGNVLGFKEKYNYYNLSKYWHFDGTVGELLESSINKTVKNDVVNTVTYLQLYYSFGLIGRIAEGKSDEPQGYSNVRGYSYGNIMYCETNDFLKENRFGELYTVFKTDKGAYIYVLMDVNLDEDTNSIHRIEFSRAYWVYDKMLTVDSFADVKFGETTLSEIRQLTGEARSEEEMRSGSGHFVRSVYITKQIKLSFLTTTGIMTVVFEKDEALDDYFVTAMEFTEGCPINPEDII